MEAKNLPGNILYWVGGVTSSAEANQLAQIAYEYRARPRRKHY